MHLAAGLRPDQLRKLTALPRPPSWILGVEAGKGGEGKGGGERTGRKGREPEGGEGKGRSRDGTTPPKKKNLVTGL